MVVCLLLSKSTTDCLSLVPIYAILEYKMDSKWGNVIANNGKH